MALFNVFSDSELKARQDQLDAQWKSLNSLINTCDDFPSSGWVEFVNDFRNWQEFYDSGSDWSSDSKHATDLWQVKAGEYAKRLAGAGCRGGIGSVAGVDVVSAGDSGIPFVKEPPADMPGLFHEILSGVDQAQDTLLAPLKTAGWVVVGVVVLIVIALVWILTKGQASGYGISVGGSK